MFMAGCKNEYQYECLSCCLFDNGNKDKDDINYAGDTCSHHDEDNNVDDYNHDNNDNDDENDADKSFEFQSSFLLLHATWVAVAERLEWSSSNLKGGSSIPTLPNKSACPSVLEQDAEPWIVPHRTRKCC